MVVLYIVILLNKIFQVHPSSPNSVIFDEFYFQGEGAKCCQELLLQLLNNVRDDSVLCARYVYNWDTCNGMNNNIRS